MRLRNKIAPALAALLFALLAWGAQPQDAVERTTTGAFTQKDVVQALEQVKKDPNLAPDRTIRILKWVRSEQDKKKKSDLSWLAWIGQLFEWITQNGRYLFWIVIAVLAGLLLVYLWRLVRTLSLPERSKRIEAPSFVRDLDIRPESLPAEIGTATRKLWESGEHRAALALLYRGLLSRLVHVHRVPIRDSSTEGDCLSLASQHLVGEDRKLFVSSLVRVWQRAVYGGESIPTETIYALCDEFARALDVPGTSEPAAAGIAAGAPA